MSLNLLSFRRLVCTGKIKKMDLSSGDPSADIDKYLEKISKDLDGVIEFWIKYSHDIEQGYVLRTPLSYLRFWVH